MKSSKNDRERNSRFKNPKEECVCFVFGVSTEKMNGDLTFSILTFSAPCVARLKKLSLVCRVWDDQIKNSDALWFGVFGSPWTRQVLQDWSGYQTWLLMCHASITKPDTLQATHVPGTSFLTSPAQKNWRKVASTWADCLWVEGHEVPFHRRVLILRPLHSTPLSVKKEFDGTPNLMYSLLYLWRLGFSQLISQDDQFLVKVKVVDHQKVFLIKLICHSRHGERSIPKREVKLQIKIRKGGNFLDLTHQICRVSTSKSSSKSGVFWETLPTQLPCPGLSQRWISFNPRTEQFGAEVIDLYQNQSLLLNPIHLESDFSLRRFRHLEKEDSSLHLPSIFHPS